jgi:hypothetical protein
MRVTQSARIAINSTRPNSSPAAGTVESTVMDAVAVPSRRLKIARSPRTKKLAQITVTRIGAEYQLELEDEAGKTVRLNATSDQVLKLADELDDLLADEELEQNVKA